MCASLNKQLISVLVWRLVCWEYLSCYCEFMDWFMTLEAFNRQPIYWLFQYWESNTCNNW